MRALVVAILFSLAACAAPAPEAESPQPALPLYPGETPEIRQLVNKWAEYYDLPRTLVHRIIQRESDYRPAARNGPYWGIMQILPATARNMGMEGPPRQLLDADTGLKYSLRYMRGAWMLSGGDEATAVQWYARGYYFEAKRQNLLQETGLRGELWQRYDAGLAEMPPIDENGRLLPSVECEPLRGLAAALRGSGCPEG
ncbi:lytic transglycosylase domain-containing protein [Jannaschia aquimarina]|uniref:Transglycosylase SLT domain protein n=1 Tax=Jannaschia aquimarina TaxID=935700 RepID=A0A0D1CL73_9RHOB|nr:lytic transglycosylase domain-containing protein [Jannaschia aquimarina]KIT15552.1 Transglycosylase SLT domain protein [Jannaschia aquimarina]SNT26832.1 Transglycosylase SLT domain-containing protein [Jannaschia aquimarina]